MNLKKNIEPNEEIDLKEFILKIWDNKWTVFFTTSVAAVLMSFYIMFQEPEIPVYNSTTEIKAISTFEEYEYIKYNDYIKSSQIALPNFPETIERSLKSDGFKNLRFQTIDKKFLYNLYVERLKDETFMADLLKKYEFKKKENYKNIKDYEIAVSSLASSIQIKFFNEIIPTYNKWEIKYQTSDKEAWQNFLKFAEKETNLEIKNYLKKSFKTQFLSQKKLLDYKIEDIDMQLSTNLENEQYISYLKDVKKILKENKSLIRLENSFNSTPIVNSDNFSAGKILFGSTIYEKQSKELLSDSKLFILACLFGLMIGLLYVFNAKNTSKYN